jgi:hypothetical protein
MSDFLDRLEEQLTATARRRSETHGRGFRRLRWSRRTLVAAGLAGLALVAVPAVAAVTGAFSRSHISHHLPVGPGLVDLSPSCVQKDPAHGHITDAPPPAQLTALLGVLRRPQTPADHLSTSRLGLFTADGVNPSAVRRARSSSGLSAYLIPAENVLYVPPLPKTPECQANPVPRLRAEAGVCMRIAGGGTCAPVSAIKSGRTLLTMGGSGQGTTLAAGVVPDGVREVIWRVRRGKGFLDTRIPVRDNVYIGHFPGRHGHGLYIFFVDAAGKHLVIGPRHRTARQRAAARRDAALDRAAGPVPVVSPASGGPKTLFALRLRVAHPRPGYVYAVLLTGRQPGHCSKPYQYQVGMLPGVRGASRGLMKAVFGSPPWQAGWCRGTYKGVVTEERGYSRRGDGAPVGTFEFEVR